MCPREKNYLFFLRNKFFSEELPQKLICPQSYFSFYIEVKSQGYYGTKIKNMREDLIFTFLFFDNTIYVFFISKNIFKRSL